MDKLIKSLEAKRKDKKYVAQEQAILNGIQRVQQTELHKEAHQREAFMEKEVEYSGARLIAALDLWIKKATGPKAKALAQLKQCAQTLIVNAEFYKLALNRAAVEVERHTGHASTIGKELTQAKQELKIVKLENAKLKQQKTVNENTIAAMGRQIEDYEQEDEPRNRS